jgi:hypothetical protein
MVFRPRHDDAGLSVGHRRLFAAPRRFGGCIVPAG